MGGMWRCFNKMQWNDFLYVSVIIKILYLSSTKMSHLMTLCKKFIHIWPESVKIHFTRILLESNWFKYHWLKNSKSVQKCSVLHRLQFECRRFPHIASYCTIIPSLSINLFLKLLVLVPFLQINQFVIVMFLQVNLVVLVLFV